MWEHDFKRFPELTNSQMDFYYFDSPHKQITENFMAKVVKVTDGDTIRVEWEERDFTFPIRFIDTDALNYQQEQGLKVKKWLEKEYFRERSRDINRPYKQSREVGRLLGGNIISRNQHQQTEYF